jgi:hypothetical protein
METKAIGLKLPFRVSIFYNIFAALNQQLKIMKRILVVLSALMLLTNIRAQSNKEEIELMQAAFGMEKKAMVEQFVNVDPSMKDAFWKLYDEYETSRKELGKRRLELFDEYAATYNNMSNEAADAWMKKVLQLTKETDGLMVDYYNKIKKATNPVIALRFYHVESFILSAIRTKVTDELPFVNSK